MQPKMAAPARSPHPATVAHGSAIQARIDPRARPPHPATVDRGAVQARMAPEARLPHPATGSLPPGGAAIQGAAKKGLNKGIDPWTAAEQAIAAYSPDALGWVAVAKKAGMDAPVIRGHGKGKAGKGMNAATTQDIQQFIANAKVAAFMAWGDEVGADAKSVKLSKAEAVAANK